MGSEVRALVSVVSGLSAHQVIFAALAHHVHPWLINLDRSLQSWRVKMKGFAYTVVSDSVGAIGVALHGHRLNVGPAGDQADAARFASDVPGAVVSNACSSRTPALSMCAAIAAPAPAGSRSLIARKTAACSS